MVWSHPMTLLVLSLACTSTENEVDTSSFVDVEAASPRHPDAAFTAEEVGTELLERVKYGAPATPALVATFIELLSHGDDACPGPGYAAQAMEYYPPQGCTAESGYWYQGVGSAGYGWRDDDGDGRVESYLEAMKVDGTMADPDDNRFTFGGSVSFEFTGDPVSGGSFEAAFLGSYQYPASDTMWLREGASTGYYLVGSIDAAKVWSYEADGGFSVGGEAVSLQGFTLHGACGTMPTGTVGVRDDQGYWYDLTYDETTCDGCGEVIFDGRQSLGQACADITPGMMSFSLDISANMASALEPQ